MANKVVVQPGVWVVLILLALVGAFFGIKTLSKSGALDKIAPKSTAGSVQVTKFEGKKPLVVALNTWVGFAPGVYFNNGFSPTSSSRYVSELGTPIQFVKMDNFDESRSSWKSGDVDVICNTADVLPTEIPNMMTNKPRVFIQIDWSRGGDKIVVRPGINSVADLKGKKIAIAMGTPSQSLIIRALEAGGLQYSDLVIVKVDGAPRAAEVFKNGEVDGAAVWAPDDEDCLKAIHGAKVLISTKEAMFAISDIFYAKESVINSKREALTAFVEGWLRAAAEINSSPEAKAKAQKLMAQYFQVPEAVMNLDFARFTTYGDNVNFFNMSPTECRCVKGEDLYSKMARAFHEIGLAPASVPMWRDITDLSILQALAGKFTGPEHAAEQSMTFTKPTPAARTAPAVSTLHITITFATNAYELTDEHKYQIDMQFGSVASGMAGFRIRIQGNTDNTGSAQFNRQLSQKRAQAMADYLIQRYDFDRNRFIVIGNGPDKPIASNDTENGKAANRRADFELVETN